MDERDQNGRIAQLSGRFGALCEVEVKVRGALRAAFADCVLEPFESGVG